MYQPNTAFILVLCLFFCQISSFGQRPTKTIKKIPTKDKITSNENTPITKRKKAYGIEFVAEKEKNMFSQSWQDAPISAEAILLTSDKEIARSMNVTLKAASIYPSGFLAGSLKKVYLLNEIKFYGLAYGGTNDTDNLFLTNKGEAKGYTDDYIERTFHHELSSIILRKYSTFFDKETWISITKHQFSAGRTGTNALASGETSTSIDEEYCKKGVLSQYSRASVEEDFNILTENLFMNDPKLWEMAKKYPVIKQKINMVIKLYQSQNKNFTLAYFQNIGK